MTPHGGRVGRIDLDRVTRVSEALELPDAVWRTWHGLILCTARSAEFCDAASGRFLHHHPAGDGAPGRSMAEQLQRTRIAWSLVARPGEECVLWEVDPRVGA